MTESNADEQPAEDGVSREGPLAWMAQNAVAANLIMIVFLVGGALMAGQITQEVFPEVDLDVVTVQVAYPGAGPEEVEQGVILAIEEAIRGVDGVDEIESTATEGIGLVRAELRLAADDQQALNDIQSEVERIESFPEDAERPVISLSSTRRQVLSVILAGDTDQKTLHELAERLRADLIARDEISVVEVTGLPSPEISVEVPREEMRRYGLTPDQIASAIDAASIELPGGVVRTDGGDVALRTTERKETGEELLDVVIATGEGGSEVTLGDVARVDDGFAETNREATYDGNPAVALDVYRVGEETPIEISEEVRGLLDEDRLPDGIDARVWNDSSEIYEDRIGLLLKNGALGLVLVLLLLGLFLETRLAFWVTLGIPISFLGAMLFMPALDVSINMLTLFAFLLALGIVVDDAIVVGEAIYRQRSETDLSRLDAAIAGLREVDTPVVFAVLTTIIAFSPMLAVPGVMGKFFRNIPLIVIPILLISLIEALVILPAHLAHSRRGSSEGILGKINGLQQRFSGAVESFIERVYKPVARQLMRIRYVTIAASVGLLVVTLAYVQSGRISFDFMPEIEGDEVIATLEMPAGTSVDETRRVVEQLVSAADAVDSDRSDAQPHGGIYAELGTIERDEGPAGQEGESAGHLAQVTVSLRGDGEREMTASDFARRWRERVGEVAGAETLQFDYAIGASAGDPVSVELRHEDRDTLERAADRLAERLEGYAGVREIDSGFRPGPVQLDFELEPGARALGITETELAR
ncbi:MAG: efflux RND transporter permease subunit, partial [Persicimonas sp.]